MASPLLLSTGKVFDSKHIFAQPKADIDLTNANTSVTLETITLDLKNLSNQVLLTGAINFRFIVSNTDPTNELNVTELGPLTLTITSNGTSIYEAKIGEVGTGTVRTIPANSTYTSYDNLSFEWYDDPVTSSLSSSTVVYEFIVSVPPTIPNGETITISADDDFYSLTVAEIQ